MRVEIVRVTVRALHVMCRLGEMLWSHQKKRGSRGKSYGSLGLDLWIFGLDLLLDLGVVPPVTDCSPSSGVIEVDSWRYNQFLCMIRRCSLERPPLSPTRLQVVYSV